LGEKMKKGMRCDKKTLERVEKFFIIIVNYLDRVKK